MQKAGPSEILVVLGMHRSGTSALTRCLNLLGYAAPKTLIKSNKSNVSGHWESQPIARLNDDLLALGGLKWYHWNRGTPSRVRAKDRRDFSENLMSELVEEFPADRPCVLKEPRICRLLPYYRDALEEHSIPVRAVIAVRNPLDVMHSLKARNDLNPVDASLLWLRYVTDAVAASHDMERAFVAYEDFLDSPIDQLETLATRLKITFPIELNLVSEQINEFLDHDLQHHASTAIDVAHNPLTAVWVSDAYAALLILCKDPSSKPALETLARIHAALDQSDEILSIISSVNRDEQDNMRAQVEMLEVSLSKEKTQLAEMKATAENQVREHAALQETTKADLSALQARLETVQAALLRAETNVEAAHLECGSLRAEIAQQAEEAGTQIKALKVQIQKHVESLAAADQELAAAHSEAMTARDRIAALHSELDKSRKLAAEAVNDFISLQENTDKVQRERDQAREAHHQMTKTLASLEKDKARLVEEAGLLKTNLQRTQDKLNKTTLEVAELLPRTKTSEKELRQLNRQFFRLKDELRWAKQIVRGYEASTSWRVTAPLRRLVRGVRGIRSGARASATLPASMIETNKGEEAETDAPEIVPNAQEPRSEPAPNQTPSTTREIGLLENAPEFDKAYYLSHYPEAELHPDGAEAHFLREGWKKGYKPSPTFETKAYLAAHPELADTGKCPLVHFIETGGARPVKTVSHLNGSQAHKKDGTRIAVFTAISNGYDDLKEPEVISEYADYFVFTDQAVPKHSVWKALPFEFISHDPTRTARYVKTHPHLYFKDYDWAIWIDGNLQLNCAAEELLPGPNSPAKILTWSHPLRNCVYEESRECIKRLKDTEDTISEQIASLRQRNFPEQFGLFETSVIVSKMGDAQIDEMFKLWWAEISRWSRRDQLSLPFAVQTLDVEVGLLARKRICMRTDPRFVYFGHAS